MSLINKDELWNYVQSQGLEMMGIAPIERFNGLAPSGNPGSIFPETRSVIVAGISIPRGNYLGIEYGTLFGGTEQRLGSKDLLNLCRYIEKSGYEAVPVLSHKAGFMPKTRPVLPGRPLPNVNPSIAYAAVAAGLGEIGYCGLVLTPAFGPRQSLGMILTDAVIEPDPVFEGRICDYETCRACANICPSCAISRDKTTEIEICGRKTVLADINYNICRLCKNGAVLDFEYQTGKDEILPDLEKMHLGITGISTVLSRKSIPNIQTALCNRTCIHHLDEEKKLDRSYKDPLRTEEPWKFEIWEKGGN